MAVKAKAPKRKTAAPAKATTRKRVSKGGSLECKVCGLSVVVEQVGGITVSEESALLCCGKPMKEKASKARVARK